MKEPSQGPQITIPMKDYLDLMEKHQALQKAHQDLQDDYQHLQRAHQDLQEGLQGFVKASTETFNLMAQVIRDQKLLPVKELSELAVNGMSRLREQESPIDMLHLMEAYKRQLIKHIDTGFKARLPAAGTEEKARPRAITKIQLRAHQLVDHIKELGSGAKKRVQLTSSQARTYLAGVEGKAPSRRDALRALERASQIFPAISYGAVPGDLRGTRRLTLEKDDLPGVEAQGPEKCVKRQRSKMEEVLPWLSEAF